MIFQRREAIIQKNYMKRKYAARLLSKESRNRITQQLPPDVLDIVQTIARGEKKSVSWIVEQIIVDYLNLDKYMYKEPRSRNGKR